MQLTWFAAVETEGAEPSERVLDNGDMHRLLVGANIK